MIIKHHVFSSVPLGIGYYIISKDFTATLLAMGTTCIIDIDHILDFIIIQRKITAFTKMKTAFESLGVIHKNYFILHSWELIILFSVYLFFNPNPWLIAIFAGYVYHLLLDQIYNTIFLGRFNLKLLFYFLLYRYSLDFEVLPLRRRATEIRGDEKIY